MGKKQQRSKEKLSFSKRNELNSQVDLLLSSTKDLGGNAAASQKISLNNFSEEDHQRFLELNGTLERIRKIEIDGRGTGKHADRDSAVNIEKFCEWSREKGAKFDKVKIAKISGYDLGLQALEPLNQNEIFIEIPKQMIFSYDKVEQQLPECLKKIPLFENMSHIRLAFVLLLEKLSADSSGWKPYLDILPDKYRTCLYFSPADIQELRGTNALPKILKQIKFIASQYAFLYKYLQKIEEKHPLVELLKENFTYELYCWAVSTVMTRQNIIPNASGIAESVLIPFWDMANHTNGVVTTTYNDQLHQIESYCLRDFKKDEQILICYGNRSNEDFLIHNGFVYPMNSNMDYSVRLNLGTSDELYEERVRLLDLLQLKSGDFYQISPNFSRELIAFLRVFNMNKGEIRSGLQEDQLTDWMSRDQPLQLMDENCKVDKSLDMKCLLFLKTRVQILLKLFATTLDEDQVLIENHISQQNSKKHKMSSMKLMLVQYRISEKVILNEMLKMITERMAVN